MSWANSFATVLGLSIAVSASSPAADTTPSRLADLRVLITELKQLHGGKYSLDDQQLERLVHLQKQAETGNEVTDELERLQREVLLFDVTRLLVLQRHEIDSSHVYTYHNEGFRPGGGLYVVRVDEGRSLSRRLPGRFLKSESRVEERNTRDPSAVLELIASPNGEILDCDLSFDGTKALFSWRNSVDEGYHLWTINVDGSGLRQLSRGDWHDYNGCWLPDGEIAFVSTRNAQFAYCWNSPVGVVHRMDANGSNVQRLSANYLNDFTPYPLDDGRIIYSRWEYVDKPAIPIQSLWTINPDGTGLAGYFGNRVISPGTFMEARSIPGTDLIICTMTGHNGPTRGAIGVIDRTKGVNAQEAVWNVTPDVPVPPVTEGSGNFDGAKLYSTPVPLDKYRFLVSARGPVFVRNLRGTCQSLALPKPANGLRWFYAQPVRPRARPNNIPRGSTMATFSATRPSADFHSAGSPGPELTVSPTSGTQPADSNSTKQRIENLRYEPAYLYVQDIYHGLEPLVKRGEVKRLRVVREMPKTVRINPEKRAFGFQFPVISAGATYAGKDILGEVDVEPDGSAYFEVPAGVPIYFMALDADGRAVQRMRSFTHLMPGEVQGCVGCHVDRGHSAPIAARATSVSRPFKKLEPPDWGGGGFDYATIVQPVLDKHCGDCHSGAAPEGKVDLSGDQTDYFNVSYETLARGRRQSGEAQWDSPYVSWIPTYNGFEANILQVDPKDWGSPKSKLADLLLDNHRDRNGKPRLQMTGTERSRILAWIDLNVPYYGTSETTRPDNTGSRRIYPPDLDKTLAEVAVRRCAECHKNGNVPRQFWTRITNPQLNSFLLAPLSKDAGGGACGKPVFATSNDPDYQAILKTFESALSQLREAPRIDMPGAKVCLTVNRSCK